MLLNDYIKQCLKDDEFRKYWEEDFGNSVLENLTDVFDELDKLYEYEEGLYEDKKQYKDDLDNLIKNKMIKGDINGTTTIELYEDGGKCPVVDFLNSIDNEKLKEKTVKNIYELNKVGRSTRMPLSRYIDDGIFELRSIQGNNIDRVFYFFVFGNKIILTNGYIKKTSRMDDEELKRAKTYMKRYMEKEYGNK